MREPIYLNFSDLRDDVQSEIISMAEEEIRNDEEEMEEINKMYGASNEDEIVRERAERRIYNFHYIFNV